MDFINSDRTLKVGDLVFSNYHKGDLLFKITKIERRFLNKDDLYYDVYKNGKVGDEYNPAVTIESVANLGLRADRKKKFRKTTMNLDALYVVKADPSLIDEQIKTLQSILLDFWP
jgi:hypothetical protein